MAPLVRGCCRRRFSRRRHGDQQCHRHVPISQRHPPQAVEHGWARLGQLVGKGGVDSASGGSTPANLGRSIPRKKRKTARNTESTGVGGVGGGCTIIIPQEDTHSPLPLRVCAGAKRTLVVASGGRLATATLVLAHKHPIFYLVLLGVDAIYWGSWVV